ncbi:MAG: SAM-dependent methyltransferase, partial [Clostridia bacterium]|nr:SAM-dependent methyltransferase [Clostridia bacterium]
MTDRLNKIFDKLIPCEVFADIGCDHGYIAKAMLDSGKCEKAIISDVSAKCLSKAENLLENYLKNGRAESVVSDGFNNLRKCNQALIAGMGGEEIAGIISAAKEQNKLPDRLIIQPMKNCDKARYCAVRAGYRIIYDRVFKSGKKY